jgi:hypothetical protein
VPVAVGRALVALDLVAPALVPVAAWSRSWCLVAQLVPGRAAGAWSRSWCLVAQLVPVAVFVFVCRPVPCLYVPARTYKHPGPRSWDRGRWPWAASPGPWPPVRAPWRVGKGPATRGPKKRAGCKLRGL